MKFWLISTPNRRGDNNRHSEIELSEFSPKFGWGGAGNENRDDLILAEGALDIDRSAIGQWGNSSLFINRNELSKLIDVLIEDEKSFPEIADKVLIRLRELVRTKK